ncbi:hypothetical protein [Streptomyces sp. NBC_01465]|uniref:hypothetical protein n=1 Tax=Streptomyces sp. NBC_01465 TaxID=2903878 RepID=UPI002E32CABD|nr:hypothetical protein [Streptomyces sp. NBC_01465]
MEWSTLLATLSGTVIGVVSTLTADHLRWRRERDHHGLVARKQAYIELFTTLSRAYEALFVLARADRNADRDAPRAREVVERSGIYEARQQLLILAPAAVLLCSDEAHARIKAVRDVVGRGHDLSSDEFQETDRAFLAAHHALTVAVREDLGLADPEAARPLRTVHYGREPNDY